MALKQLCAVFFSLWLPANRHLFFVSFAVFCSRFCVINKNFVCRHCITRDHRVSSRTIWLRNESDALRRSSAFWDFPIAPNCMSMCAHHHWGENSHRGHWMCERLLMMMMIFSSESLKCNSFDLDSWSQCTRLHCMRPQIDGCGVKSREITLQQPQPLCSAMFSTLVEIHFSARVSATI